MLTTVARVELIFCWIAWMMAFSEPRKKAAGQKKTSRDPASAWGIALIFLAFMFVWSYVRPRGYEQPHWSSIASMLLGPPSVSLAWSAARHLGKQWRFEAAITENHELIQTGPYHWIRHPIYTSMLGMYIATGLAWTWWPLFVAGLVLFLAGTEIRVRAEDRLLAERFGETFAAYRSRVRTYVPFVW